MTCSRAPLATRGGGAARCLSLCSAVSTRRCVMALGTRSVTVLCTRRVYETSSLCMSPHSYMSPLLSCSSATCAGHGRYRGDLGEI